MYILKKLRWFILIWTILIIMVWLWNIQQLKKQLTDLAVQQAHIIFDIAASLVIWTGKHENLNINPAYILKELVVILEKDHHIQLHPTSLKPYNPQNAPDNWETQALMAFEAKQALYVFKQQQNQFRYIEPLYIEQTCLHCHAHQGYKMGDIRGGLTIDFTIDALLDDLQHKSLYISILYIFAWLFVIISAFFAIKAIEFEKKSKALEENTKLREDIERITRHDLKSPINGIIGLPELMLYDENLDENQRQNLKMIEDVGYQLLNMINLSLDLYKMEVGKYEFQPVSVEIIAVINKILNDFAYLIRIRKIKVLFYKQDEIIKENDRFIIQAEELLCYSMLSNLIKNAIEASPKGESIIIFLQENQENYTVIISNKGAVPEKIRKKFFEKYVTQGKEQGTGLGTYSARLIAQTQGGEIYLDSSSELNKTTITIFLPKS